jgi:hypothetical protein
MALGGIVWGFSGQIAGTRPTLLAAALLLFAITVGPVLLFRTPRKALPIKDRGEALRSSAI